jgi:hypothetical protein
LCSRFFKTTKTFKLLSVLAAVFALGQNVVWLLATVFEFTVFDGAHKVITWIFDGEVQEGEVEEGPASNMTTRVLFGVLMLNLPCLSYAGSYAALALEILGIVFKYLGIVFKLSLEILGIVFKLSSWSSYLTGGMIVLPFFLGMSMNDSCYQELLKSYRETEENVQMTQFWEQKTDSNTIPRYLNTIPRISRARAA